MKRLVLLSVLSLTIRPLTAQPPQGYYQYPTPGDEVILFAAEGDLWVVDMKGGLAKRLTTHAGEESHPRVSPDGKTVAFAAAYEGPTELYTMPIDGGLPVRLTYEASRSLPVNWTPDGRLAYTTQEYSTLPDPQLVVLDLQSRERMRIPLSQAGNGSYDSSGRTLFFERPGFHRNNTKRYKGGTARNIWRFGEGDREAENLTADFPGENHSPMWWKGRVYYVCDRDGTMNIWSMAERGTDLKQHTRHSGWDVKDPSLRKGKIVYQSGADIYLFDAEANRTRLVPIALASDFDQLREKWVKDPMEYLTSAHLHPKGESVVLTARGRVFVAPAGRGRFVQASRREGVRYRDVVFLPGTDKLLGLSDETGEFEFVTIPANGLGEGEALTSDGRILRFQGYPSPDGRWIAYSDRNNELWLLEVETGNQKRISENREGILDISWAPDSRWLAFTMRAENTFFRIHLHGIEEGRTTALTSDRVNSISPAWSPKGDYIYFLSDRNLESVVGSPWGPRQPEPFFHEPIKVYSVSLRRGLRSPFLPDDELSSGKQEPDGTGIPSEEEGKDPEESPVRIDLEGIDKRIKEVPVPAGNYRNLNVSDKALYWLSQETGERNSSLMVLEITSRNPKPKAFLESIRDYELSLDGKKILVTKDQSLYVVDAGTSAPKELQESRVDLAGWTFPLDVREDYRQLFIDAWRMERDYFYDPNMHGVDWVAMKDKYLPLVDRVTNRQELSDLIGQLVGELSALHISVRGGDLREGPDQIRLATLGARLERDEPAGGYRIDYIYQSDPDYPDELSPLADPDLNVQVGDILVSINGTPTLSASHPNALLRNQPDRPVLLEVKQGTDGSLRRILVKPTADESGLRYRDWEYTRRKMVEEQSSNLIGYVHLKAMGGGNLTEWYRNFYPVFNRKGLVIDVRHNRGGNIDSIILEKLLREAWFYWKPRAGNPTWNMQYAFRGHMVVLCNENTASDGEAFAEGFRRLGLGKVIGTRTWGGEVWLSDVNRLTDGGIARAPQTGVYGPEGVWLIEGHGVDPDIVVDNLPHATFQGQDAQLEAAIQHLLEQIEREPVGVPEAPPYPDKSFPYPKE